MIENNLKVSSLSFCINLTREFLIYFLKLQTSKAWSVFILLNAFVAPKPTSILSSGKWFSLVTRSIFIKFFVAGSLNNMVHRDGTKLFKSSWKNNTSGRSAWGVKNDSRTLIKHFENSNVSTSRYQLIILWINKYRSSFSGKFSSILLIGCREVSWLLSIVFPFSTPYIHNILIRISKKSSYKYV